jgi:hypothetical protein
MCRAIAVSQEIPEMGSSSDVISSMRKMLLLERSKINESNNDYYIDVINSIYATAHRVVCIPRKQTMQLLKLPRSQI